MTARLFKVGVFEHPRKKSIQLAAYTRYYNPSWEGCCEHEIVASSGSDAKRIAMQDHRRVCMAAPKEHARG